jgi:arylsulfatase A-like enzyme
MFTGRFPHELGADWEVALDSKYPTLAEVFKANGYYTAGFVANTGYCSYEHGLDRGFAHYDDYQFSPGQLLSSSTLVRTVANNFRLRRTLRNDEHLNRRPADDINESFLRWLSKKGERPFFAFLNYYDAHDPYLPPAPFDKSFGPGRKDGKLSPLHRSNWDPAARHQKLSPEEIQTEIDAYDGAIAYLDHQLGLLFDELERRGLQDNTLVVVTSDHGEEFGEHGVFDHGNSLYLSGVHVPLLIAFPSRVPAGKVVSEAVSLRDLPATVLDVLQIENRAGLPGSSLAERWSEAETVSHHRSVDPLLSEVNFAPNLPEWYPVSKGDMKALVLDGYRYIRNGDGREELYDFIRDPFETNDLSRSAEGNAPLERYSTALKTLLSRQIVSK